MKISIKFLTLLLSVMMVATLFIVPTVAACSSPAIIDSVVDSVIVAAEVEKLNGNQNKLRITLIDDSGTITQDFMIKNNAEGTYKINTEAGDYLIYVDTKGNTQIKACYIVSYTSKKWEIPDRPPTMEDYWLGVATFENFYNDTGYDNGAPSDIVPVNGVWYRFGRLVVDAVAGTVGVSVRKSTDKGLTWTAPVAITMPGQDNDWSENSIDASAYYDGEKWHMLFQSKTFNAASNNISYLRCNEEDATIGTWYEPDGVVNPVIRNRDLWNQIAVGDNNCVKITGGERRIYEEGTPKISVEDDGTIYVTFHGVSITRGTGYGYRGIVTTDDFINYAKAADDCIFSYLDAENWNVNWESGGTVGGGAAAYIKEGEYWYTMIESPDMSLGIVQGQNWPFGLLRSKTLNNTEWDNWIKNPMPEFPYVGLSPAWAYPALFKDDGVTYLGISQGMSDFAWRLYKLVWIEGNEGFETKNIKIPTNSENLDLPYIIENTAWANDWMRVCDGPGYIIYKFDLNEFPGAVIGLEISQNYIIEISGDGKNFVETHNFKKSNPDAADSGAPQTVINFNIEDYDFVEDTFYFKISNTDSSKGWGGTLSNIYVMYKKFLDSEGNVIVPLEEHTAPRRRELPSNPLAGLTITGTAYEADMNSKNDWSMRIEGVFETGNNKYKLVDSEIFIPVEIDLSRNPVFSITVDELSAPSLYVRLHIPGIDGDKWGSYYDFGYVGFEPLSFEGVNTFIVINELEMCGYFDGEYSGSKQCVLSVWAFNGCEAVISDIRIEYYE